MRILGIDPGIATTGWGLIEVADHKLKCLDFGTIQTSKNLGSSERLNTIALELSIILDKSSPDLVIVEEIFFAKNRKTAVAVAQARGVIMAVAHGHGEVLEMTPLQVKQFIAFSGKAGKERVGVMVKKFLGMRNIPKPNDKKPRQKRGFYFS